MDRKTKDGGRAKPVIRAVIEVSSIVFLFYSNLLMGEFTAANGQGKTLSHALHDVATGTNFAIGICSAVIGYVVFEFLRRQF
jgi:hypothetical protein